MNPLRIILISKITAIENISNFTNHSLSSVLNYTIYLLTYYLLFIYFDFNPALLFINSFLIFFITAMWALINSHSPPKENFSILYTNIYNIKNISNYEIFFGSLLGDFVKLIYILLPQLLVNFAAVLNISSAIWNKFIISLVMLFIYSLFYQLLGMLISIIFLRNANIKSLLFFLFIAFQYIICYISEITINNFVIFKNYKNLYLSEALSFFNFTGIFAINSFFNDVFYFYCIYFYLILDLLLIVPLIFIISNKSALEYFLCFENDINICSVKNNRYKLGIYSLIILIIALFLNNVDINNVTIDINETLKKSLINGDLELSQKMIEAGAKFNFYDYNTESTLPHIIKCRDYPDFFKTLLEKCPEYNNDKFIIDVIDKAILYNKRNIFNFLIERIKNINSYNSDGETLLMVACNHKNIDIIKLLISRNASINFISSRGYSALYVAVASNNEQAVKILIENGAGILCKGYEGGELLFLSIQIPNYNIFKIILDNGADINYIKGSRTTLMHAAQQGNAEIAKTLIEKGVPINTVDCEGDTALALSIDNKKNNKIKIFNLLISSGANDKIKDKYGRSILDDAMFCNDIEMQKIVIDRVDTEEVNNYFINRSIYSLVYEYNFPSNIRLLIKKADKKIFKKPVEDFFNLHTNQNEQVECIKFLLDNDFNYEYNINGITALSRAISQNNYDVVKLLIKKGASIKKSKAIYDDYNIIFKLISYADEKMIDALLNNNIEMDLNIFNSHYISVLRAVLDSRNSKNINLVLSKRPNKYDAIYNAAINSDFNRLKLLFKYDLSSDEVKSIKNILPSLMRTQIKADVFNFLIEKGADVNAKDENGLSLINIAEKLKLDEFIKLLKEKGAH